jgi:hypothetical protein
MLFVDLSAAVCRKRKYSTRFQESSLMKLKKNLKLPLFITVFCSLTLLFHQTSAQQPKPSPGGTSSVENKINRFLENEEHTKVTNGVWSLAFKGKSLGTFNIFLATVQGSDIIVIGTVIAEKENVRFDQDLLYKLLKYNHVADYVKVGIDEQGDLFLRAEVSGRLIDQQEFLSVLEQVAAAADQLHGQIRTSLVSPPKL